MDDFHGLLAKDFGLKPQGKSAPMAPPRNSPAGGFSTFSSTPSYGFGSSATDFTRSSSSSRKKSDSVPIFDDHDRTSDDLLFKDVFGGHGSSESRARSPPSAPAFDYDDMFKDQSTSKSASMPVFDKPVYDDDIFEGIPGLKSSSGSASARYENVFASDTSSPPKHKKQNSSPFDDIFGDFGTKATEPKKPERVREEKDTSIFDDLIPGFGRSSSPPTNRSTSERTQSREASPGTRKQDSNVMDDDPFSVFKSVPTPAFSSSKGVSDPLEEISKFSSSGNRKSRHSSAEERVFDDLDPLDSLGKAMPDRNNSGPDRNHARTGSMNGMQSPNESSGNHSPQEVLVDDFSDSPRIPSVSIPQTSSPSYVNRSANDEDSQIKRTSRSDKNFESSDDVWLTVSEIPLFTQPTSAPPPSRPPPPRPTRPLKKKVNEPVSTNSPKYPRSPRSARASAKNSMGSQIDELEEFAMRGTRGSANGYSEVYSAVNSDANSVAAESAAAMKDAMDKAEAKFRHAREMRGKESKATKIKEGVQRENKDYQERERQERLERERLEKERELERAREIEEREEREREQRRIERERIDKERELARQAVERATREARERAAAGAHAKAQRAAVEKAATESRERTERAAVQRAQAEARERAAVEARARAEKTAAERANAEAREREARDRDARTRMERAAVERAAAEARQRAAAQARVNQHRNENDFDAFSTGSRPSSAPRQRAQDPLFNTQNKGGSFDAAKASSGTSNIRKASSATNIVDDLSSIFGAATPQSMTFQDVEGESEERRRARMERNQRTQERAAKALAEKNERDLQVQREQAEKNRVGETLDVEIKRWAAGKEGNLRALLSTLQYVLWPECGWQPVSLTDLITAASVKKVYRKATLCIHPDKVQQKGANIQQKYVAEKVFDLLKEAWNKFNSEELF